MQVLEIVKPNKWDIRANQTNSKLENGLDRFQLTFLKKCLSGTDSYTSCTVGTSNALIIFLPRGLTPREPTGTQGKWYSLVFLFFPQGREVV